MTYRIVKLCDLPLNCVFKCNGDEFVKGGRGDTLTIECYPRNERGETSTIGVPFVRDSEVFVQEFTSPAAPWNQAKPNAKRDDVDEWELYLKWKYGDDAVAKDDDKIPGRTITSMTKHYKFERFTPWNYDYIIDNLFLGNYPPKGKKLKKKGFKVVCLCAEEYQPTSKDVPGVTLIHAPTPDYHLDMEIVEQAEWAAREVLQHLKQGKKCLISCFAGHDRSAFVCALVLHYMTGLSGKQCADYIREMRKDTLKGIQYKWMDLAYPAADEGEPDDDFREKEMNKIEEEEEKRKVYWAEQYRKLQTEKIGLGDVDDWSPYPMSGGVTGLLKDANDPLDEMVLHRFAVYHVGDGERKDRYLIDDFIYAVNEEDAIDGVCRHTAFYPSQLDAELMEEK